MKRITTKIAIITAFALMGFASLHDNLVSVYGEDVTVKLVLGKDASLSGYTASDDEEIFHENVVTYTATSGSPLPTPTKTGTTFVSWVYAENSELVRVATMPLSSGAIYFAYWLGDGSLATGTSSSSSSSSETSSSTGPLEVVPLYLDTGGSSLWNQDGARFYVYTFNPETAGAWPGFSMGLVSGDIYTANVPIGFTSVIFIRVDPTNPATIWNQTADLTYSSAYNLYTITGWNQGDGVWSVYDT